MIEEIRKGLMTTAKKQAELLKQRENVVGTTLYGSLVAGDVTLFSDVDIIAVIDRRGYLQILTAISAGSILVMYLSIFRPSDHGSRKDSPVQSRGAGLSFSKVNSNSQTETDCPVMGHSKQNYRLLK